MTLVVRYVDDVAHVWDPACGACSPCRDGWRIACRHPHPVDDGDRWRIRRGAGNPDGVDDLVVGARTHEAVRSTMDGAPVVAIVGSGTRAHVAAFAALGAGARTVVLMTDGPSPEVVPDGVVCAKDSHEARDALAAIGESGRADLVLDSSGDLQAASLTVRRGGVIASLVETVRAPTMTTMVQRELTVHAARDLVPAALDCALAEAVSA